MDNDRAEWMHERLGVITFNRELHDRAIRENAQPQGDLTPGDILTLRDGRVCRTRFDDDYAIGIWYNGTVAWPLDTIQV